MSVPASSPQATYPATTTTTTNTTATTTTAAVTSSQKPTVPPRMSSKPVGWHAKNLGYDWHKRADHHKYLVETGLPAVHAAVINHDWETAAELLCPSDIGLFWTPPVSQRPPMLNTGHSGSYGWSTKLLSQNEELRNAAIIEMSLDLVERTNPMGTGSMYGANLLTLCLEKRAPREFLQKVIILSQKHAPQYLNNPDASGKTPLYAAIQRGDKEAVAMLLDAGADWRVKTNLIWHDGTRAGINTYFFAMEVGSNEIFELILSKVIQQLPTPDNYPIADDPLKLCLWIANHAEEDVLRLAEKFPHLRFALFSFPDKSGTSFYHRKIENDFPVEVNIHSLINPVEKNNILHLSVTYGSDQQFFNLLNFVTSNHEGENLDRIATDTIKIFLKNRSPESIKDLSEQCQSSQKYIIDAQKIILEKETIQSFEKFKSLFENVLNYLSKEEKISLFINLGKYDLRYFFLFIEKAAFALDEEIVSEYCKTAASWKNTKAFEFAFEQSNMFKSALESPPDSADFFKTLYYSLRAGSLKWVETLMQRCTDFQGLITKYGEAIVPAFADCDPSGFSARFQGINIGGEFSFQDYFDWVYTNEGRQALADFIGTRRANN